MKGSQKTITTLSTLEGSKAEICSSKHIIPSAFEVNSPINEKRSAERAISIMEQHTQNLVSQNQQVRILVNNDKVFNKNKTFSKGQKGKSCSLELASVLERAFFKKKRYSFQVLKQFYLFPDQSQSSINSLSTYDPLIFQDEIIHSLAKILQTKQITNKIWGFLNLKMRPYLKAAAKIEEKITKIHQRTIRLQKKVSFESIKKAADEAISAIIIRQSDTKQSRCLQVNANIFEAENKQTQLFLEQKKSRKNCLSSNMFHEQVKPEIKTKPQIQQSHSSYNNTTRIYTREEYELKYGKMKENNENLHPRVIRISATDYPTTKPSNDYSNQKTTTYTQQSTSYKISPPLPVIHSTLIESSNFEKPKVSQTQSPRKYNIINYHERPRQVFKPVIFVGRQSRNCSIGASSCSQSCYHMSCCCESSCVEYRISNCRSKACCSRSCYEKCQKSDIVNETGVTEQIKIINGPKSTKTVFIPNQNPQLSQLQSRIQYLNFLKKLVKEQQCQPSS